MIASRSNQLDTATVGYVLICRGSQESKTAEAGGPSFYVVTVAEPSCVLLTAVLLVASQCSQAAKYTVWKLTFGRFMGITINNYVFNTW